MQRAIKAVVLTEQCEPEVIGLINEFASVQRLKPTTALKRFILRNFPNLIKVERQRQEQSLSGGIQHG